VYSLRSQFLVNQFLLFDRQIERTRDFLFFVLFVYFPGTPHSRYTRFTQILSSRDRLNIVATTSQMALARKLALVTGSTSGIGLGIAKKFAAEGANVLIHGLGDPKEIQEICSGIQKEYKVTANFIDGNVASVPSIEKMMKEINTTYGGVDIVVNNAGIQHVAPIDEFPVERWDQIIAINLSSVFHITRLALPSMKQKDWGRILNIASVHGLVGSTNKSAYVAAKHGVVGLTKVTALENARTGVTANAICPGWVLTPLVEAQIKARATANNQSYEEAKVSLLAEKQPSGEFVTTDQLGSLAVFLSSDAASEIRGVAWQMDGGWTAQ
jgi:3-hydroxybutyrate dehydrogenase